MWKPFRCRLFRDHDYQLRTAARTLFLECRSCGHRSTGLTLPEERLKRSNHVINNNHGLRLLMGEVRNGDGAVIASNVTRMPLRVMSTYGDELRLTFAQPGDTPVGLQPHKEGRVRSVAQG
jgi:hypothetical protein